MGSCSREPDDTLSLLAFSSSPSEGTPAVGSYGCTPQSLPKFQHPSHELLKENGFTQHVYHKYRRRCLNGKKQRGLTSEVQTVRAGGASGSAFSDLRAKRIGVRLRQVVFEYRRLKESNNQNIFVL